MPYNFLADTDLNFDPQAFFNDYMYTGKTNNVEQVSIIKADILEYRTHNAAAFRSRVRKLWEPLLTVDMP